MDRPPTEGGASETVEAGQDDLSKAGRGGREFARGGVGPARLVEDVRDLGAQHRNTQHLLCEPWRAPPGRMTKAAFRTAGCGPACPVVWPLYYPHLVVV